LFVPTSITTGRTCIRNTGSRIRKEIKCTWEKALWAEELIDIVVNQQPMKKASMELKNVGSRVSVNIISSTEKMVQRKEDRQCTKQWYIWPHFILLGNLVQY